METLKKYWKKIVLALGAVAAGIALVMLILKKSVTGELGDYLDKEAEARRVAKEKEAAELARLQKEKEEAEAKAAAEAKAQQEAAEKAAKEREDQLKELEKRDKEAFKEQVNKQLGVKEKKKGRPKKNV